MIKRYDYSIECGLLQRGQRDEGLNVDYSDYEKLEAERDSFQKAFDIGVAFHDLKCAELDRELHRVEKFEAENRHLKAKLKEADNFSGYCSTILEEKDAEIARLQTDLKVNLINKDSFEGIQTENHRLRDENNHLKAQSDVHQIAWDETQKTIGYQAAELARLKEAVPEDVEGAIGELCARVAECNAMNIPDEAEYLKEADDNLTALIGSLIIQSKEKRIGEITAAWVNGNDHVVVRNKWEKAKAYAIRIIEGG